MITITLATNGERLEVIDRPIVACGDQNSVQLEVAFCGAWDGYAKTAVFYCGHDTGTVYEMVLDTDNCCMIPAEVLASACDLYIGLRGVKGDGSVLTSEVLSYTVKPGAPGGTETPEDPTPTVYEQIMAQLGETSTKYNAMSAQVGALSVEVQPVIRGGTGVTSIEAVQEKFGIKSNSDRIDSAVAEIAATAADLNAQKSRIDQITSLAEGSTTGDAELMDIRVGADGVTYDSAGTAVRTQISNLENDLVNGFRTMATADFERGSIGSDGADSAATHRMRSITYEFDYPVTLKVSGDYQFGVFFYDGSTFKGFYAFSKNDVFIAPNKQFRIVLKRDDNAYMELDEPKALSMSIKSVFAKNDKYADYFMLATLDGNTSPIRNTTQKTYTAMTDTRVIIDDPSYVFRVYSTSDDVNFTNICDWVNDYIIPAGTSYRISICNRDNTDSNVDINSRKLFHEVELDYCVPRDYYIEEIEDTIAKVKEKMTEPCLAFFLATDIHYMSQQYFNKIKADSITDMVNNMKYIASKVNIDGLINLGDNVDCLNVTTDVSQKQIDYVNRAIKSIGLPILTAIGNHDDNHYIEGERFDNRKLYSNNISHVRNDRVSNNDLNVFGTDYYVDFPNYNIRVISLNAVSYGDYTNTASKYGYSDQTCQWFQNVMRNTEGMGVIVLTHTSPIFENNGWSWEVGNYYEIKSTIQEYINAGKNYICTLYGHLHLDYSATEPWTEITLACQKGDGMTDEYASTSGLTGYVNPTRTVGTALEDCWDVLIIKPFSGKIETVRFGAGTDRTFEFTPIN